MLILCGLTRLANKSFGFCNIKLSAPVVKWTSRQEKTVIAGKL